MARIVLEGVKVGDAIRSTQRGGGAEELFIVERLTATQAVCQGGKAFRIESGLMIGTRDKWYSRYGWIATPDDVARIALDQRIRKARDGWRNLVITADNLEAVEALLKGEK